MFWKRPESMGWGNVIMCISDLVHNFRNPKVHSSLLDVERGVDFSGIDITDEIYSTEFAPRILINNYYYNTVHRNISKIVKPSKSVQDILDTHTHLVSGVTCGIHIRRGAFSDDSKGIGCHGLDSDGNIVPAFFANDSALEKFELIVARSAGPVFLASDSKEVKAMFIKKFPDKVRTYESNPVLTYKCEILKNYITQEKDRLDCYVEWFLLSMCPRVVITAGDPSNGGISTFGYTAACYGIKEVEFITN
jgi:hypothetical protein